MQDKIYSIILDIKAKRTRTDIEVVQFDNKATIFNILLRDGLNDYVIGDGNVEVIFGKPDGTFVVVEKEILNDSNINVVLTEQILAKAGVVEVEVEVSKEDKILTSTKFEFSVRKSIKEHRIPSTTEYKGLVTLLDKADEVVAKLDTAIASLDNVDELKKELADINEKIIAAKEDIENSINTSKELILQIETAITNTENALAELENKKADIEALKDLLLKVEELNNSLTNLNTSISEAKKVKLELDTSINTADTKITDLSLVNETANSNILSLGKVNTTASETDKNLKATNIKAESLDTSLKSKIESGQSLSTELADNTSSANTINTSLESNISSATDKNTTLSNTIESATQTNSELNTTNISATDTNTSLNSVVDEAKLTESKLLEIIALGDLNKYITDDKLRESLIDYITETNLTVALSDYLKSADAAKTYATKSELEAIDVSGQLVDYEKTTEVDKKISAVNTEVGKKASTEYVNTELGKKANTDYVTETLNTAIEQLVDNAPEALNTLKELSDALGNDANFANTIAMEIGTKVDKKIGYGLTPNEYTDVEKLKVRNIPANPQYTDTVTKINGKTGEIGKDDIIKVIGNVGKESTIEDLNTVNAYDIIFQKPKDLYKYMNGFFGINLTEEIQTFNDIINNLSALTMLIINATTFEAVINSTVAMEKVANSAVAMEKVANSAVAMEKVANSTVAMEKLYSMKDRILNFKENTIKKGKYIILNIEGHPDNSIYYAITASGRKVNTGKYNGKYQFTKNIKEAVVEIKPDYGSNCMCEVFYISGDK